MAEESYFNQNVVNPIQNAWTSLTKGEDLSGLPYEAQAAALAKRQKLAELLMQQGQQQPEVLTYKGIAAQPSVAGGLGKALSQFMGAYMGGKADENLATATAAEKKAVNEERARIFGMNPAVAATPLSQGAYKGVDAEGIPSYDVNLPTPAKPASYTLRPEEQIDALNALSGRSIFGEKAATMGMPLVTRRLERGDAAADLADRRAYEKQLRDAARAQEIADKTKTPLKPAEVAVLGFRPGTVVYKDGLGNISVEQAPDYLSPEALRQKLQLANAGRARTDTAGGDLVLGQQDDLATGITGQTGLPLQAFAVLTGNAGSLPRDAKTRSAAFSVANQFLAKRGVDAAGFIDRYKANTQTLQKNIARVNQVEIMQDELIGTIENLTPVAEAVRTGKLRVANALAIAAGKEIDSPEASEYGFQLQQLRTELAGYNAALQGRSGNNIFVQDQLEADRLIKDGLSTGGISGIKTALQKSTAKMKPVLDKNVDKAQKRIWELFGVGDKYKNKYDDAPVAGGGPPPAAIADLKRNPATSAQFDQVFGAGAAAKVLGK